MRDSYRPRCANLSQSQFILAIPMKLVGHAAPLPGSLFFLFKPCRRNRYRWLYLRFRRICGRRYEGREEIGRFLETPRVLIARVIVVPPYGPPANPSSVPGTTIPSFLSLSTYQGIIDRVTTLSALLAAHLAASAPVIDRLEALL
jgi:hypothetical protein